MDRLVFTSRSIPAATESENTVEYDRGFSSDAYGTLRAAETLSAVYIISDEKFTD